MPPLTVLSEICVVTFAAGVIGTGIGGLFGVISGSAEKRTVAFLLSLSAGIMLSVVCFDLLAESLKTGGVFLTCAGTALGFLIIYILSEITRRMSPAKRQGVGSGKQLYMSGLFTAAAIALHNFPEGMVIGSSGVGGVASGSAALAVVIGVHNIPEGAAIALPLKLGGMKSIKAVTLTALAGAPTVLGAIFGYFLGTLSNMWLSLSLSLASGAMLYVVFGELLPESENANNSTGAFAAVGGILLGMVIVAV